MTQAFQSDYVATAAGLLRAIREVPEDDDPRLVYADFLEEQAGDVACPKCGGTTRHQITLEGRQYQNKVIGTCSHCSGSGRVPNGNAAYSEFIRVQVELAGRPSVADWCRAAPSPCYRCGDCLRFAELGRRQLELFKSASTWFPLPGDVPWALTCLPESETMRENPRGPWAVVTRGFIGEVRLPTAAFVGGGRCDRCNGGGGWTDPNGGYREFSGPYPKWVKCFQCDGHGTRPGIAAELFGSHPVTRVVLTNAIHPREYGGGDDRWAVWRHEIGPLWDILCPDPSDAQFVESQNRDELERELSLAAVAYGRAAAGLPPLRSSPC